MNRTIKLVGGIIAIIIGGKYLIDAIFIGESIDYMDAAITRGIYLIIGLSLFAAAYYFGFRNKKSLKQTA